MKEKNIIIIIEGEISNTDIIFFGVCSGKREVFVYKRGVFVF
jgi:hypothetical protein